MSPKRPNRPNRPSNDVGPMSAVRPLSAVGAIHPPLRAFVLRAMWAALLTVVALAPQTASAGRNLIGGQITDRNGQPIERALVSLAPGNVQLVTDGEGRFAIDYLRDASGSRERLDKKTEYKLGVYKPGFHPYEVAVYYKKGAVQLEAITLAEDTVRIEELPVNLDPGAYADPTHSAGANYEGQ